MQSGEIVVTTNESLRLFAFHHAKRFAPRTNVTSRRSAKHPHVGMRGLKGQRIISEVTLEEQPFQRARYK